MILFLGMNSKWILSSSETILSQLILPLLTGGVVVWTRIESGTGVHSTLALLGLVDERMELGLLPAMAVLAVHSFLASFVVIEDDSRVVPVRADIGLDVVPVWLSSVVLPVVSIHTMRPIVLDVVDWTETSLVVKHEKIVVKGEIVDQFAQNVLLRVSVAAKLAELALLEIVWKVYAKSPLVVVRMVVQLDRVVTVSAQLPVRTWVPVLRVNAHETRVPDDRRVPSEIFRTVVVGAFDLIMFFVYMTFVCLEFFKDEMVLFTIS